MILKIRGNAAVEAGRLLGFPVRYRAAWKDALKQTLDIARQRVREQTIKGGASMGGKSFSKMKYIGVPGATIQRKNKTKRGKVYFYGEPIFHKTKIVSRSGDFLKMFEKGNSAIAEEITEEGKNLIGTFNVEGDSPKVTALEFTGAKGGTGTARRPVWKAMQFASKRFLTILALMSKRLDTEFYGVG